MDKEVSTITPAEHDALLKLFNQWEREYIGEQVEALTGEYAARLCRFAYFEGAKAFQSLHQL